MSDAKIITGLRLSEAVKLLEENENALIRTNGAGNFWPSDEFRIKTDQKYDVKLPPPKNTSVTVTRNKLDDAWLEVQMNLPNNFEQFCKELGL